MSLNSVSDKMAAKLVSGYTQVIDNYVALASQVHYNYTMKQLDKKVNEDETLREYILNTEKEFDLEHKELSESNLNDYVKYLDSLWR